MPLIHALQYAGYGLVFLTMISVLVAGHELGHYLVARWFGMGVEEFAIGFGRRPLFTWMRREYVIPILAGEESAPLRPTPVAPATSIGLATALEGSAPDREIERIDTASGAALRESTDFTVRPWPLGGFVRIKGMMPEEDGSETRIPGGFYSKAPWKRFLVLLAGPVFSILGGVLVLIPALMVDGQDIPVNKPVLADVLKNGAADRAGLKKGDVIVAIDGRPIATFYQIIQTLQVSHGKPLSIEYARDGAECTTTLVPTLDTKPTPVRGPDLLFTDRDAIQYKIEAMCMSNKVPLSLPSAATAALDIPVEAVDHLFGLVRKPAEISDNLAGPASIVSATAEATKIGIWAVLKLAALLSISVGILNLLPAPPLDGGQMAMSVGEMLRGGKRLSIRAQAIAGGIGLTFVAALIFAALAVDFKRFTTPDKPLAPAKASQAR